MISVTHFTETFGPEIEFTTLVHLIGRSFRRFLAVMNFPGDSVQRLYVSFHTIDSAILFSNGFHQFPPI